MPENPRAPNLALEVLGILRDDSLQRLSGRRGFVQALSRLDKVGVIETLVPLVSSAEDSEIRYRALDVLVALSPAAGISLAISLLASADSTMRWLASGLLSNYGDERAIGPLLERLVQDPEPDVRIVAALALGRIGDQSVIPRLRDALVDEGTDWEGHSVSRAAADAIGEIKRRYSTRCR